MTKPALDFETFGALVCSSEWEVFRRTREGYLAYDGHCVNCTLEETDIVLHMKDGSAHKVPCTWGGAHPIVETSRLSFKDASHFPKDARKTHLEVALNAEKPSEGLPVVLIKFRSPGNEEKNRLDTLRIAEQMRETAAEKTEQKQQEIVSALQDQFAPIISQLANKVIPEVFAMSHALILRFPDGTLLEVHGEHLEIKINDTSIKL